MSEPGPDETPLVGVLMGSKSDWETMSHAVDILKALGVPLPADLDGKPLV